MINNIKEYDFIIKVLEESYKNSSSPSVTLIAERTADPFNVLISAIISTRTKDQVTLSSSKRLFEKVKNFSDIQKISSNDIEKLIYPAGFYKTKARRIKEIANIIENSFHGKIPDTLELLLTLPGVGRKIANLVLSLGFDKPGLCVDTHVHRITNRLGWVNTKKPDDTEFALRIIIPQNDWRKLNDYLVSYGQTICRPISPFCSICRLNSVCPKINVDKMR